jgi:hypothetical protein
LAALPPPPVGAGDVDARAVADAVGRSEGPALREETLLPLLVAQAEVDAVCVTVVDPSASPCALVGCRKRWLKA